MAANKIVFGNKVLIDLTSDTVSASNLLKGFKAHDKTGMQIIGTYEAEELIGNILENGFASGDITYEETTDTITATNNTTGQVLTKRFSGNKVIHHHNCGRTDFGDHIVDTEKIGSQPHTQFVHSQSYDTQQDKDYELAAFIGIFIGLKYKRNT